MLISEARDLVRFFADSPATDELSDANIDLALEASLDRLMMLSAQNGHARLAEYTDVTTTASGTYDLSTWKPASIAGVAAVESGRRIMLPYLHPMGTYEYNTVAKDLMLMLVPGFRLDRVGSVVQAGSGLLTSPLGVRDLPMFERMACAFAAIDVETIDRAPRQELRALAAQMQQDFFGAPGERVVGDYEIKPPHKPRIWWTYEPNTQLLRLVAPR